MRGWVHADAADGRSLRDLFGTFLTGVTVVTAHGPDGAATGFTANSFTSVSLAPPLILVCVANTARSHAILAATDRFGVNILSDAQREVSSAFASRSGTRFAGIATWSVPGGPPFLADSLAAIDCARENVVAAGDHTIVIGRVLGFRREPGRPLGYYAGGYVSFGMGSDALERRDGGAIVVGAVIGHDNRVLLVRRPGKPCWELPSASLGAGERHGTALPRLMSWLGVEADVFLPFSISQAPGDTATRIVFRAALTGDRPGNALADGTELALFAEQDAPWSSLARSEATILRRYYREQAAARFGIYWDTDDGGRVASLQGTPLPWRRDEPDAGPHTSHP